jgi:alpha-beta hydrolase superfamily lysophospholipase
MQTTGRIAMAPSRFSYASSDGTQIAAYRWDPAGQPRAAVQLTHGMGEHAQRYGRVAKALIDAGYVVYAQDQRGHRRPDPVGRPRRGSDGQRPWLNACGARPG